MSKSSQWAYEENLKEEEKQLEKLKIQMKYTILEVQNGIEQDLMKRCILKMVLEEYKYGVEMVK